MRPLRITGNSIFKRIRALASILGGCCDELWKDAVVWDDDCDWEEPTCGGEIWVNSEIWDEECPWPWGTGFPYTLPLELE